MPFFRLVKAFRPYLRAHKGKILVAIVLSFGLAGLGAGQVSLIRPIVDHGLSPASTPQEIYQLAGLLLAMGILHFPCRFFHFFLIRSTMERIILALRQQLFEKFQSLPFPYYTKNKQGEITSRIINDVIIFADGFRGIIDLIREPLKAMAYLSLAFISDWPLALIILVLSPLLWGIFWATGRRAKQAQEQVQKNLAQITHQAAEGLGAIVLTRVFQAQRFVGQRFLRSQKNYEKEQIRMIKIEEISSPIVEVVGALGFCGAILFAHYRMSSGGLTVGDFIRFIGALALLIDPVRKLSQGHIRICQAQAAFERIEKIFHLDPEPNPGAQRKREFHNELVARDVSFSYGQGRVVKNLSFYLKKGEKVAFVGPSGSGKTTVINLLLGLYPLAPGHAFIDGIDLCDLDLDSRRSLMGLVSQDIFLFNDTIEENLLLGKCFSRQKVQEALKISYAHEFVEKLPHGLETVIGDRGIRLSGGQKQRLTMARAFLHDAPILLFDEATSALDNESEQIVQKAINSIAGGKTILAVAHRLTSIQHYDRIYVMKDGQVIESGPHTQLLKHRGEYAKLYFRS